MKSEMKVVECCHPWAHRDQNMHECYIKTINSLLLEGFKLFSYIENVIPSQEGLHGVIITYTWTLIREIE